MMDITPEHDHLVTASLNQNYFMQKEGQHTDCLTMGNWLKDRTKTIGLFLKVNSKCSNTEGNEHDIISTTRSKGPV